MKPSEHTRRRLALATLLATALSGACSAAVAAPKAVEAFDATTWPALQQARQPVAVARAHDPVGQVLRKAVGVHIH